MNDACELVGTLDSSSASPVHIWTTAGALKDRSAPLIIGAETGYSCLKGELAAWPVPELRAKILEVADGMRDAKDGLWLASINPPLGRRLVLVQSNRGAFYRDHHGPGYAGGGRVWRDFYARASYYAFDFIDSIWSAASVEVAHPTGSGWPPGLLPSFLDGLRRWSLSHPDRGIQDVYLRVGSPCELRSSAQVAQALDQIAGEPETWQEVPRLKSWPRDLGYPTLDQIAVFQQISTSSTIHEADA